MPPTTPVALTIAGFDSCAGAGLQADLLTFHNHGYHTLTASTALVVETPLQVRQCEAVSAETLNQQIELLLATYQVATIKIGLLSSPAQALIVSEMLGGQTTPIVLDPVGISSTGSALQQAGTSEAILEHLAPLVTLLTPNFPEARSLIGDSSAREPAEVALQLAEMTGTAVLLTGGHHGDGDDICDLLCESGHSASSTSFCAPRIASPAPLHGTGCVLSSAIAAQLGKGADLSTAIEAARRYLRKSMSRPHHFPHPAPLLALNHHLTGSHDQ